ncbi:MAG: hypothetical protein AB7E26_13515 [Chryseobacterium sp.]
MKLFEDFRTKFEQPNWARDLELGLIDTLLEQHPHLIALLAVDITKGDKRRDLFYSQLGTFIKTINQVSNVVKKSTNTALRPWFYVWNWKGTWN